MFIGLVNNFKFLNFDLDRYLILIVILFHIVFFPLRVFVYSFPPGLTNQNAARFSGTIIPHQQAFFLKQFFFGPIISP